MTLNSDPWTFCAGICRIRARIASNAEASLDSEWLALDLALMCNRYEPATREAVTALFGAREVRAFNDGPSIVHPREPGLIVRLEDGERVLDQMTWGFPVTLKGKKGQSLKPKPVNNARFDKLGSFWRRWAGSPGHRCLIPTASFAEAVGKPGSMTCTWLSVADQRVFAWAGLWSRSDEWGDVYTGVMTQNAPELGEIHDRSPVILEPDQWAVWLSAPLEELYQFDRPYPADRIRVRETDTLWSKAGTPAGLL